MGLAPQPVFSVMKIRKFHLLSLVVLSVLISQPARAVTGVAGQVGNLEIIGSGGGAPGNYDFRVSLTSGGIICNGQNWTYINTSEANYSALVASILSAKTLGLTVTLYVDPVGAYCHLDYLVIN
jgi:hypothetical protein